MPKPAPLQRKAPLAAAPAGAPAASPAPRDPIDQVVDEALANWQPLLGPLVGPLVAELDKALAAGETLAAFAARLPDLVKAMDAQPLANDLARRAFGARLAGEADLDLTGLDT